MAPAVVMLVEASLVMTTDVTTITRRPQINPSLLVLGLPILEHQHGLDANWALQKQIDDLQIFNQGLVTLLRATPCY